MSLRRRVRSLAARGLQKALGVTPVNDLSDADADALRVIARLFQIVDREPVYASALEHVDASMRDHFAQRAPNPLVRALLTCLLNETADRYDAIGYEDHAATLRQEAQWIFDNPDGVALRLATALADQQFHDRTPLVVDAVVRALFGALPRTGPRVDRLHILCSLAYVCYTAGHFERLRIVTDELGRTASTPGYRALHVYFQSKADLAHGAHGAYDSGVAALHHALATVPRTDPAYRIMRMIARGLQNTTNVDNAEHQDAGLMDRVGTAMHNQQWAEAAELYERLMRDTPSPSYRALYRLFAEVARVRGGDVDTVAGLDGCLDRLIADNVLAARSLGDIEEILVLLLDHAVRVCRDGDNFPVARICDLLGEFRGGAAVRHNGSRSALTGDAAADLALVDCLAQPPAPATAEQLAAAAPNWDVIWINRCIDNDGPVIFIVTLPAGASAVAVRRVTGLDDESRAAWSAVLNADAENADAEQIHLVRECIFSDLPARDKTHQDRTRQVLVIPDRVTWDLPWAELVPPAISEFTLAMSAGSSLRLPTVDRPPRPRVIGIFDQHLSGAMRELATLERLDREGRITLTQATSLAELAVTLEQQSFDVLSIGVHGTTGDGFEYRMLLPDGPSSPSALLAMRLPPTVVLGCCWSATSAVHPDTVAASLVCLVGGASEVVGGLWAIDDRVAGEVMARTYELLFSTAPTTPWRNSQPGRTSLTRALLQAHRSLEPSLRQRSAGLAVAGRIDGP